MNTKNEINSYNESRELVGQVPCKECGDLVEIAQFTLLIRELANSALKAKGEDPLADNEITYCPKCAEAIETKRRYTDAAERSYCDSIWQSFVSGQLKLEDLTSEFLDEFGYRNAVFRFLEAKKKKSIKSR